MKRRRVHVYDYERKEIDYKGYFLGLGVTFIELRDGVGACTTAIIEQEDGFVVETSPDRVRFVREASNEA